MDSSGDDPAAERAFSRHGGHVLEGAVLSRAWARQNPSSMIAEQLRKRPAGMVLRDPPGGTRSEVRTPVREHRTADLEQAMPNDVDAK